MLAHLKSGFKIDPSAKYFITKGNSICQTANCSYIHIPHTEFWTHAIYPSLLHADNQSWNLLIAPGWAEGNICTIMNIVAQKLTPKLIWLGYWTWLHKRSKAILLGHRTHAFIGCVCIQAHATCFCFLTCWQIRSSGPHGICLWIMMSPIPLTWTDLNDDISWTRSSTGT